jgi:hypothetical protein
MVANASWHRILTIRFVLANVGSTPSAYTIMYIHIGAIQVGKMSSYVQPCGLLGYTRVNVTAGRGAVLQRGRNAVLRCNAEPLTEDEKQFDWNFEDTRVKLGVVQAKQQPCGTSRQLRVLNSYSSEVC